MADPILMGLGAGYWGKTKQILVQVKQMRQALNQESAIPVPPIHVVDHDILPGGESVPLAPPEVVVRICGVERLRLRGVPPDALARSLRRVIVQNLSMFAEP